MKRYYTMLGCLLVACLMCGYSFAQTMGEGQTVQQNIDAGAEAVMEIDEELSEPELVPGYVTVNFKDADIRAVLNYLSDVGGVDIVPAPDVSGPITLKLTNKPWQTALDIIVRNYGYAYEREGNIIRVVTVDSLKMEELATEVVDLNYAKADTIIESVKDMLTERGKITADDRTNVVVITDVPANIYKMKKILAKLDRKTPQIMIEAKIIEIELSKGERMGIDWGIKIGVSGSRRPTTIPFNAFTPDWGLNSKVIPQYLPVGTTGTKSITVGSGGATTTADPAEFPTGNDIIEDAATYAFPFVGTDSFSYGTLDFSQFSAVMEYIKTRGGAEIISNPRITTLNNKEAKIFVGRVYYYISKMERDSATDEVSYEYKEREIGIRLLVTPNVNEDEEIKIHLKPEIKAVVGFQALSSLFSMPIFSTREAETEVMIEDGETIFIGGLMKEDVRNDVNKFPLLGDLFGEVPFIGNLVRWKQDTKKKTELVFFITVNIVKDRKWLLEQGRKLLGDKAEVRVPLGPDIVDKGPAEQEKASKKKGPWFDMRKKKKE